MQRWRGLEAVPPGWGRCVATIGVFDGVHRGHQQIISQAVEALGADVLCLLPFTLEFSRMSPKAFAHAVLVERLHAAIVVVGDNFRFGHQAAGGVDTLVTLGAEFGFAAIGVPLLAGLTKDEFTALAQPGHVGGRNRMFGIKPKSG